MTLWQRAPGGLRAHAAKFEEHQRSRLARRLRALTRDARRKSVAFSNEHLRDTFVERQADEALAERSWRAVCRAAAWFAAHLDGRIPIVLVSDRLDAKTAAASPGVAVLSMHEYLVTHHADADDALQLYQSLRAALDAALTDPADSSGALFSPHRPDDVVQVGIRSGVLFGYVAMRLRRPLAHASVPSGKLTVSHRNPAENAFVDIGHSQGAVLIRGARDRNRARAHI